MSAPPKWRETGPVRSLFGAIIRDDRARMKGLLRENSQLIAGQEEKGFFTPELCHWIYAGDTALHVAAAGYRVEIARTLLETGAEINAAQNHRRTVPLHYAADGYLANPAWDPQRQVAMIRLLLEGGADIAAQDKNGATPLHRAVRTRCAAAVRYLLEAGSDAAARNLPGSTPFHLAVQNTGRGGSGSEKSKSAQREIIQAFLKRGISPRLKDERGRSVLQWARSDWIRRLLANGSV